jgi:hypothetical protein
MPGRLPKDPILRQRRNKSASRAVLPAEVEPIERAPSLPDNPMGDWHKLTKRWWRDVWTSPQHHEFLRADLGALFRLAVLVDKFWKTGSLQVAGEVRLMEREFGLTPLSRRRLEWSVTQAEEAANRHEDKRSRRAKIIDDPRGVLG